MPEAVLCSPNGTFAPDSEPTAEKRHRWIRSLAEHPSLLRSAVSPLSSEQLDTPYRSGGWSIRQIVHHLADNQMQGFLRMRWALTEEVPVVKTYDQDGWAALPDSRQQPVRPSVDLMAALYRRWTYMLGTLDEDDFTRTMEHPDAGPMSVDEALQMYDWHGRHHIAQITELCDRNGW